MAKFGQFKFSEAQFGSKYVPGETRNRTYRSIPLGLAVRRQINNEVIYRVRTGNNNYGAPLGKPIQDKYDYFVPSSINNIQSKPQRRQWIAAVHHWKYCLSVAEKKAYNNRAHNGMRMSGYNLFMREAMKGLVQMYVDRGDPAAHDFTLVDLTTDGAWHTLDVSAIIPKTAQAVLWRGQVEGAGADWTVLFRKYGNTNEINVCCLETLRANIVRCRLCVGAIDHNQKIEYKIDNENWGTINLTVRGWWT